MSIHHAVLAKAQKAGVILEEKGKDEVRAFHPKHALEAWGANGGAALEQITALMRIKSVDDSRIIVQDANDKFMVAVFNHDRTKTPYRGYATPTDALAEILKLDQAKKSWLSTTVPSNGREAHKQGFTAADNPFDGDDDEEEAAKWDEEFDAAIEEDEAAGEDTGGSVVKQIYRIRYAEAGHPNHNGDWLAVTLNNLVLGKTQTDIEHFEELCNLNDVSLAKYDRTRNGWQGRLRMTGRNLLAPKVYASGILKVPASIQIDGVAEYRAPEEWLAAQNFKIKRQKEVLEAGRVQNQPKPVADQMAAIKKSKGKK